MPFPRFRTSLVTMLVLLGLAACGDDGDTPPAPSTLEERVTAVVPAGGTLDEATDLADEIVRTAGQGDDAASAAAAFELAELVLGEYYGGRLPASLRTQPRPLDDLLTEAFRVAGLGDPGLEAASFSDDGLVAVVRDAGGLFVTATQRAGIDIPGGAVPRTTLLAIRRLPDSSGFAPRVGPLPTALDQYPLFYDFGFTPDVTLGADGIIGLCQLSDPASAYYAPDFVFDILQLAHPDPDDRSTIELLERVDAPFLNCDGAAAATRGAASLAQRRGGIGGRVRKFSPFGAVDPLQSLTGAWSGTFRSAAAPSGAPVSYTLVESPSGGITGTYVFLGNGVNTEPGTMTATLSGRTALNWTMTNTGDCPGTWNGSGTVDTNGTVITSSFTGSDCTTGG
ncbi:MAG: hypothetical protein MUC69_02410, partial [Gemmatimonadales bacterium]|nr:hypothetical protein [Gemmatimonadales bacterium]